MEIGVAIYRSHCTGKHDSLHAKYVDLEFGNTSM